MFIEKLVTNFLMNLSNSSLMIGCENHQYDVEKGQI